MVFIAVFATYRIGECYVMGLFILLLTMAVAGFIDFWAHILVYGKWDAGEPMPFVDTGWARYVFLAVKWYTVPLWGPVWLLWQPVI